VLTEREHEIALLVARRLSNKEIAQQLFLSVRTVESHIYAARGKLGAGSRRELGERVREQDARDRAADDRL
jgi:DNA-binding CsgD family transcriptional regulator